jgi:hydroxyacylglutathione hydrolase
MPLHHTGGVFCCWRPAGNFAGAVINISDLQIIGKRVQLVEYLKRSCLFQKRLLVLKGMCAMWKKRKPNFTFRKFSPSGSEKNEYLLINQDEAATIDVCESCDEVLEILYREKLSLKYLLVTHAHRSHLTALPKLKTAGGGTFCLCKDDYDLLKTSGVEIEPDTFVKDNAKLELGDGVIRVLHTPGHTRGSLCFYVKNVDILFSGRTLDKDGYGTIWGPTSMSYMLLSLKRLDGAIASATVYPGRGESTTMQKEAWLHCLRSH